MKNKQDRQILIDRYLSGESISFIMNDTGIPRSTLYYWIKTYNKEQQKDMAKTITPKHWTVMERKIERLKGLVEILQKAKCTATAPLDERLYALEMLYGQYNIHMLCEALDVARSTFYNHIFRNKKDRTTYAKRREELRIRILEVYNDSRQIFGSEKIAAVLKNEGIRVSREMVLELMRDMGLASIRQDAKSFYVRKNRKLRNLVNQNFQTDAPNQVWVGDITYFRFNERSYYICVIIDLFSRMVVGYKISMKGSTQLTKSTFKQAYEFRNPSSKLIFHSDQGGPYQSKTYQEYMQKLNVEQSFSKAHVPYDNSVVESFFASMKKEELYRTNYRSENEFKKAVDNYIIFYNTKRPHAKLKYKTPKQAEADYADNH